VDGAALLTEAVQELPIYGVHVDTAVLMRVEHNCIQRVGGYVGEGYGEALRVPDSAHHFN